MTANQPFTAAIELPERLAVESRRPVLAIPHTGYPHEFGRIVLVACKPTREAARAVFDAMPSLREAERVLIVEVTGGGLSALVVDNAVPIVRDITGDFPHHLPNQYG
jgi:hypothetical protein